MNKKITFITLQNFKSFSNVSIDFRATKTHTKNISIIFGENGSGKSSIIESIDFLHDILLTKNSTYASDMWLNYARDLSGTDKNSDHFQEFMEKYLINSTPSLENLIQSVKSLGTSEPMTLKYGFQIDGFDGEYSMTFNDSEIIEESMYYRIGERHALLWDINGTRNKLHEKLFLNAKYRKEILDNINKYWGKHTLFSLLYFEVNDKTDLFIQENFSNELKELYCFFSSISYSIKYWDGSTDILQSENVIMKNLDEGSIPTTLDNELDRTAISIGLLFQSIFTNIKNVYYKKRTSGTSIEYELMLTKQENGFVFQIPFSQESSGTQELLHVLPYLVAAMNGEIVFLDEFGTSLHEQLVPALIKETVSHLKGQLVITTHHLSVLDKANLTGEAFYYITAATNSEKRIICTTDIEERLHTSYNYRNRYLTRDEYHLQPTHTADESYINFDDFLLQ